ncbi:MAG: lactate racemase domain-containing protein, partial [Chloroflexota bacterium]
MGQYVDIPWGMWQRDNPFRLEFPPDWRVTVCSMHGARTLTQAEIDERISHPLGRSWQEIASGAGSACIAVDDLARPTPARRILPALCEELRQVGIREVSVIIALGCHRPLSYAEMIKKIGEKVMSTCRAINHNPHYGLIDLGCSSRGTPFQVNGLFCRADLKIVMGSVTPNYMAGYGGGAKLVLPGLSGSETTRVNHGLACGTETGNLSQPIREDMEELAELVGVDVAVSCVLNENADICDLYVGDLKRSYPKAVERAHDVNLTLAGRPADILVLNSFPKDNELTQIKSSFNPVFSAQTPLVRAGGTVVAISAAWDGIGYHALFGNPAVLVEEHLRRMAEYAGVPLIL